MLIELGERNHWFGVVGKAVAAIEGQRAEEDSHYEAAWRKQGWRHVRGDTEFPPHSFDCNYPSHSEWGAYEKLKDILLAFPTYGVGRIEITGEELRLILQYSGKQNG